MWNRCLHCTVVPLREFMEGLAALWLSNEVPLGSASLSSAKRLGRLRLPRRLRFEGLGALFWRSEVPETLSSPLDPSISRPSKTLFRRLVLPLLCRPTYWIFSWGHVTCLRVSHVTSWTGESRDLMKMFTYLERVRPTHLKQLQMRSKNFHLFLHRHQSLSFWWNFLFFHFCFNRRNM